MSDGEEIAGCIGGLLAIAAVIIVVVIVLYIIYYTVIIMAGAGAVFGAGTALRNYGLAFAHNVRPEEIPA